MMTVLFASQGESPHRAWRRKHRPTYPAAASPVVELRYLAVPVPSVKVMFGFKSHSGRAVGHEIT